MRLGRLFLLGLVGACGSSVGEPPVVTGGFRIVSPDITIMPGEEVTYCYYFDTPNTEDVVVAGWSSEMTPGSHHMIFYTTATDVMPPGTVSKDSCGGFNSGNFPSWTYAAQTPTASYALPTDDGSGLPLGQKIAAGTPGYFQMHYRNDGDEPLPAHVQLDASAYSADVEYTQTAAFVTYNSQISIPPGAVNHLESMTCSTPDDPKFWMMSTHAHKQAVTMTVKDGDAVVFTTDDWEHPRAQRWDAAPFYTFATGTLTWECTYSNVYDNAASTVVAGPSADTNEMCMATGYYFPAEKPLLCLNTLGPF